ncbi:hypothetical protein SteCoe_26347 [Stentor coeruleus]|uniref:Molybdopterin synthase sulfur carrier subunit n=1 Tax=Stentor coeruleus TaxID=5963 RepID=A0A1R2BD35_9CILI|nr:hypothetical protein SteCoe_26347 [Stentor coeruleus]
MKITVLYFAQIKELVGIEQEFYYVSGSLKLLLDRIQEAHPELTRIITEIQNHKGDTAIAVNMEISHDMMYELRDEDEIAFIPPISGG